MHRLFVTRNAKVDIDDILAQSEALFGSPAAERYRSLIDCALKDLADDPSRNGVRAEPGLPNAVHLYPLRIANYQLARSKQVSRPRHILAFRYDAEAIIVLHDRMDKASHLGR